MPVAYNRIETKVQRRLTRAYIKAEPALITLKRPQYEDTLAGGKRRTGLFTTLDPQLCRLVPFKRRIVLMSRDTFNGDVTNLPYVLVGYWDMDVAEGDRFVFEGATWKVGKTEPNRAYRTTSTCTYEGPED